MDMSNTTCSSGNIWVLPIQDAACALPNSGNYSSIMDKCCTPATVEKYDNDCGLYCLAQGQSVKDLLNCIQTNGGGASDVFCNSNLTATATASLTTTAKSGATETATTSGSQASTTKKSGAIKGEVNMMGVGMLVMLVCRIVMGAV